MVDDPVFYVYVIYRPDGRPCYVGKGKGRRVRQHFTHTHNLHLQRIIAQAGGDLPFEILENGLSEPEAFRIEMETIEKFGRQVDGGPLVNLTNGGEGGCGRIDSASAIAKRIAKTTGRVRTPEMRARMSDAQKRFLESNPNSFAGRSHTEKTREKIAAIHRGRIISQETREKISASLRAHIAKHGHHCTGKAVSESARLNMSIARLGKKRSEETRQNMRDAWVLRRARRSEVTDA